MVRPLPVAGADDGWAGTTRDAADARNVAAGAAPARRHLERDAARRHRAGRAHGAAAVRGEGGGRDAGDGGDPADRTRRRMRLPRHLGGDRGLTAPARADEPDQGLLDRLPRGPVRDRHRAARELGGDAPDGERSGRARSAAEVGDLDRAGGGEQQVLELEAAVRDPVRLGVLEPGERAFQHAAELRERQAPGVRAQRPPLGMLGDDVRRPVDVEAIEDGHDVRVRQRARGRTHARGRGAAP